MHSLRAVIFANGELRQPDEARRLLRPGDLLIAADGGAAHCRALGLRPNIIVGDFDSLTAAELADFERAGARLERHPSAKDETDLELALLLAVHAGAGEVVVVGALGGRLDMTIANVLLLTHPALTAARVWLWNDGERAWLIRPPGAEVAGRLGDTLSLIPLGGDATGITTHGLAYPLRGETLAAGPARGVSNVLTESPARVELQSGVLLATLTAGRA